MKWIDAEQKVNITIFDEQTDDRKIETMTIEEILDTYTDEGCPEGYFESNWIPYNERPPEKEGAYFITTDKNGERCRRRFFLLSRRWYTMLVSSRQCGSVDAIASTI